PTRRHPDPRDGRFRALRAVFVAPVRRQRLHVGRGAPAHPFGAHRGAMPLHRYPLAPAWPSRCRARPRPGAQPARCSNSAPFFQSRRALAPAPTRDPAGRPPDEPAAMTSTAELSSPASAGTGLTRGVVDPDYTLDDKFTRT